MAFWRGRRRQLATNPLGRGQSVCDFIEHYCLVPEGAAVGRPMRLLPFQVRFIKEVYDNPRRTSRAYLSVARKNGKSALIAAILLAHICGPEARLNSQIISGARSRDQAALVFKLAEKMVRLNPELSEVVRIIPSSKSLLGYAKNVEYRAISAEAGTAHGLSPVLAILDEVGQIRGPQDSFVEAIETAQGAHEDPLLIAISTQAAEPGDLFSTWLDDAAASADPRIICHLYSAPEGAALTDREAWAAANPALGHFRHLADVEHFAEQAARMPAKEQTFRWLFLNQRIETDSVFLTRREWEANGGEPQYEHGDVCYAGLDLSQSRDLTALVLVFPKGDGSFDVAPRFYLPAQGLKDKSDSERIPYALWASQGFLHTHPGNVIQPGLIAEELMQIASDYDLRLVAFDRWHINYLRRELNDRGADLPMTPFGQGYKDMAPALDKVERLVAEHKLRHGGHPVLGMCAGGAVVEQDAAGNRKLHKGKSYSKIDGMVALAMALGSMTTKDAMPTFSAWDDPGFSLAS